MERSSPAAAPVILNTHNNKQSQATAAFRYFVICLQDERWQHPRGRLDWPIDIDVSHALLVDPLSPLVVSFRHLGPFTPSIGLAAKIQNPSMSSLLSSFIVSHN